MVISGHDWVGGWRRKRKKRWEIRSAGEGTSIWTKDARDETNQRDCRWTLRRIGVPKRSTGQPSGDTAWLASDRRFVPPSGSD